VRAFLGVPADPAWAERVRQLIEPLRAELPRASWTRPESWHVTLKFLGEVTEEVAESFAAAIEGSVADLPEGELVASPPILFPPGGRGRVAGMGFRPGPTLEALARLAAAAEASARAIGCRAEERAFEPHVTLARLRRPWPPSAVAAFTRAVAGWPLPPWRVTCCVLYRSRLDPAGAVHTPVRRWEASGAARAGRA